MSSGTRSRRDSSKLVQGTHIVPEPARQLYIIHLSDPHFGARHRFDPPPTAAGDVPKRVGYPKLMDKLREDLPSEEIGCPCIVCVTGDIATTADPTEFVEAEGFISELSNSKFLGKDGIGRIFVVPGNHDVVFDKPDYSSRWRPWTEFTNRTFGTAHKADDPWGFIKLHDRVDDLGAIILCLNSAIYVEKGKPEQDRGNLDVKQLEIIENTLEAIEEHRLRSSIRIALIHHHPVLIPPLAEAGRGYDAVHNSGQLISLLRRFGFHLVLHGHKHSPFTFTDDTNSAFQTSNHQPLLIAAGGSVGTTELPDWAKRCNCYNQITVKWHEPATEARIVVDTRGLELFNPDGTEKLPDKWKWFTLRLDDRRFYPGQRVPECKAPSCVPFASAKVSRCEAKRKQEYERCRGNMPVVEVVPSLTPGQTYEARAWIVGHPTRAVRDVPERVTWSCGEKFGAVVRVLRREDSNFCAVFNYWGPVLLQAQLEFQDG